MSAIAIIGGPRWSFPPANWRRASARAGRCTRSRENYQGEVAKRWRFDDGGGEVGFISSVSQPFCGACSRARLSSEGKFYTCLFATQGLDLRAPLRDGADDADLLQLIRGAWRKRTDRYSELREELRGKDLETKKIEMYYIGG